MTNARIKYLWKHLFKKSDNCLLYSTAVVFALSMDAWIECN